MTAITQRGMNAAVALAIPVAGLAYLMSGDAATASRSVIGMWVGLTVLWAATTVAFDTKWRSGQVLAPLPIPEKRLRDRPRASGTVDVNRPVTPWRWTSVLLAPLELLALAWTIPFLMLLVMVPIGLVIASALWAGRALFGL